MSDHPTWSRNIMLKPITVVALVILTWQAARAQERRPEARGGPPEFKYLRFRSIGPAAGGRVCRAVGIPGNPNIYYAAASAGGIWKTTDAGLTWKPIFDNEPVSSVGSIAVAASDPNVVYAGTGEANIRGNVEIGNGIYKSVDAGKTWKHVWKQEGQIGTMIVHPKNPDVAFAAVFGKAFGPNAERGVYRTTDGGKSWQPVLQKDANTGASDVCFDPSNPHILFAGLWQARRRPWDLTSGGPGSGLYMSRDAGDHWKHLTGNGLPKGTWGRVGVAVAPSNGQRVYALIEAKEGGLYRSNDGGDHWERANGAHYLSQRAWYYNTLTVDPANPDVVWVPQVHLLRSIDAGATFKQVLRPHHSDHHDIWIDPKNPNRVLDSNDGGVDLSTNGGDTWYAPPLPIAQFYHVAADTRIPYYVSGCMQDLGTAEGPTNTFNEAGILLSDWYTIGGGEAGYTAHDPSDPNIVYAGEYGGFISRFDLRTHEVRNISVYPTNPSGHGAVDLRYRFQWTAPIMVSPHDAKTIYHAANVLFRTSDAGMHWQTISPDLTRNDRSKQRWSGGPLTGDNTGAEYYDTIFAIAESPRQKGVLWAGSDDGLVHVSRDDGKHWADVTPNIHGIPEWGTVTCVEASPFDPATAYVVVDNHRMDDNRPYLWKTADFGQTWKRLSDGLPKDAYLKVVREDPARKGLLYVGSAHGVHFSRDDGAAWKQLKLNLPTVQVNDLLVKDNDLVLATEGRSLWIFDDLTPIRAWTPKLADKTAHLFPPRPAMRFRQYEPMHGARLKQAGANPPDGAIIYYSLKKRPKGKITLDILDDRGRLVEHITSKPAPPEIKPDDPDAQTTIYREPALTTEVGVNRVAWDLTYEGARHIPYAKVDLGEVQEGPMVNVGVYTLKLTVDGQTETAKVHVVFDPRLASPSVTYAGIERAVGSLAALTPGQPVPTDPGIIRVLALYHRFQHELQKPLQFALEVRDSIGHVTDMVEQIRAVRKQLEARNALLKDEPKAGPLVKASRALVRRLDHLEERLHNPRAEVTYDILAQRGGAKLYSKLIALFEWLKQSDGGTTQGMREVYAEEADELRGLEKEWQELLAGDLAKLAVMARAIDVPSVIVPRPSGEAENGKALRK
jgi:photosystem II stability/assembly factor-like uncharacterized protein